MGVSLYELPTNVDLMVELAAQVAAKARTVKVPLITKMQHAFAIYRGGQEQVVFTTALGEDDAFKLRLAIGPGLRIKIPMLGEAPLALDFGIVVADEPEDERQLFTFSLSRDF